MATIPLLLLVPFAPPGMLAPNIFRALATHGFDPAIMVCESGRPAYEDDPFDDFGARGRLHDMRGASTDALKARLFEICMGAHGRRPSVVLQVGAYRLYPWLPILKEAHPDITIVDLLYNPVGHTVDHFLYDNAIDAVLVESEYMAGVVRRNSQRSEETVMVAHSGVDLASFPLSVNRASAESLTVGYIGRMSGEKNPLGFLQIAEDVGKALPQARFYIAGAGPMSEQVKARAKKSPIAKRIETAGYVEDVRQAFRRIDVLVVPSKTDGRPVAVMEANACGVPVLAAPVGGLPEMIASDSNGWLLPPSDTASIVAALTPLATNDLALSRMKSSARRHAEANFDERQMVERYSSIFRSLARQGKDAPRSVA